MFKKLLGKLLVVSLVVCMALFAVPAMAVQTHGPAGYYEKINGNSPQWDEGQLKYFKNGHPGKRSDWQLVREYDPCHGGGCDDALALAESGIVIVNRHEVIENNSMSWGSAGARDLNFDGSAFATGKDSRFWFFKIPGFAWADVDLKMVASVSTKEFTTGEKLNGGLSFTYANSVGTLKFNGDAIAIGNDGCPQWAEVSLNGDFRTSVGAYSLSIGPNGSYGNTWGLGITGVRLTASDSDFDKNGWFIFPPKAHAGIDGLVIVKQDILVKSYVSPDGTTSFNFGIVRGGSAMSFGDANIIGIRSSGFVGQAGQATDGIGAAAFGNSYAAYNGAKGYTYSTRCADFAGSNSVAVVTGYNNVTHTGNSVSITSSHSAFATTGNFGLVKQQRVD